MFHELDIEQPQSRSRFFASMGLSLVVYGIGAALLVTATAVAKSAISEEELVQVEFAQAPEPPPPPPPVAEPPPPSAEPPSPRTARARALTQPVEIPDETPEQSDEPLAGAGGVPGGSGEGPVPEAAPPPPPVVEAAPVPPAPAPRPRGPIQLPEQATPPSPDSGNRPPAYPEAARSSGVNATVIAKIVVERDGSVGSIEIMRGHPLFDEEVRRTLATWRFEPARLDGEPIAVFRIIRVPFRLDL